MAAVAAETDVRYTTGAILAIQELDEGQFEVNQVESQDRIPKTPNAGDKIYRFGPISIGPVTINGEVDLDNLGIKITVSVLGITIGSFGGNLKDGLGISVNLIAIKGKIRLYLKNGNEVWINISLHPLFGPGFDIDKMLFKLPI